MYNLVIDSSTDRSIVALALDGAVIKKRELPLGYHGSRYLMPSVAEIFDECEISPKNLKYIVVGAGPGSYTGMRVAAVIGKTLAYSLTLPLVGVTTMLGFIPSNHEGAFVAVLDARFAGAYAMKGHCQQGVVKFTTAPAAVSLEELGAYLKDIPLLVTADKEKLERRLHAAYPSQSWTWEEKAPAAEALAKEGHKKFIEGSFSEDSSLEILYLRQTQAELNRHAIS